MAIRAMRGISRQLHAAARKPKVRFQALLGINRNGRHEALNRQPRRLMLRDFLTNLFRNEAPSIAEQLQR